MTLKLPEKKVLKLICFVKKFLKIKKCSIRLFSQFIGSIVAVCPAVKYGWSEWSIQSWFPLFKRLVVGDILYLGTGSDILHLPFSREKHPMGTFSTLSLVAAKLSGKPF